MLSTDPLDAAFDADGDLDLTQGGHFVTGLDGVAQLAEVALRMFRGEWFLNLDEGFTWFEDVLGQKYDERTVRALVVSTLRAVPGVTEVASVVLAFDAATRDLSITAALRSEFGDLTVEI